MTVQSSADQNPSQLVAIENGTLRIGGKWYALTHLSSVEAGYTQATNWLRWAKILLLTVAAMIFFASLVGMIGARRDMGRFTGNKTGPRYVQAETAAADSVKGLACSAVPGVLGALLFAIKSRPAETYHVLVVATSGEHHRIDFPDARACLAFCGSLTDAIRASGSPVHVDARQVHLHAGSARHGLSR